jgi:hypothetical protein
MALGMATVKITITLPKALVASGAAPNLSAFVKHAVDVAIQDAAGWRASLDEALEETADR